MFDPRALPPADTSGWILHDSACYGYSILLPPAWELSTPFSNAGYQQGENATLRAGDNRAKIDLGIVYTPADLSPARLPLSLSSEFYLLDGPNAVTKDGRPARELYVRNSGELRGVSLSYFYAVRPDWYFSLTIYLTEPYDEGVAREARAIVESLIFR